LSGSRFRSRFRLNTKDRAYLKEKGLSAILDHAAAFIAKRLAPAHPLNDGQQTPLRGHPVFVAQHATATCCRRCLAKWHNIDPGRQLAAEEQSQVLAAIEHWLQLELMRPASAETTPSRAIAPLLPLEGPREDCDL
jgi:hypothetical protein